MSDAFIKGTVIKQYTIEKELGRGGMGIVYRAYDSDLDRPVVIKTLTSALSNDEVFVKRFTREAKLCAQLNHPNIVHVYSVGVHENSRYIAMEYVEGHTLEAYITKYNKLGVARSLQIVIQAAKALQAAHKKGIIHRDIKPQNIMLNSSGHTKVLDFGLAKSAVASTNLTQEGTSLGTPTYMSPEQCQSNNIGPESDIYSLGIVLYEMLSGGVPFDADTTLALMYKIVNEPLPSLHDLIPSLPAEVVALVNKMAAKDPAERHASAAEIIADCEQILESKDSWQRTPTPPLVADILDPVELDIDPGTFSADAPARHASTQSTFYQDNRKSILLGVGTVGLAVMLFAISRLGFTDDTEGMALTSDLVLTADDFYHTKTLHFSSEEYPYSSKPNYYIENELGTIQLRQVHDDHLFYRRTGDYVEQLFGPNSPWPFKPMGIYRFPMKLGDKGALPAEEIIEDSYQWNYTVDAEETVTVPAGTFSTLRVTIGKDARFENPGAYVHWVAPGVGVVKIRSPIVPGGISELVRSEETPDN